LKVSAFHTPLSDLFNRRSSPSHLRVSPGLRNKLEFELKGTYDCHVIF
jgi:hypothetical protein